MTHPFALYQLAHSLTFSSRLERIKVGDRFLILLSDFLHVSSFRSVHTIDSNLAPYVGMIASMRTTLSVACIYFVSFDSYSTSDFLQIGHSDRYINLIPCMLPLQSLYSDVLEF